MATRLIAHEITKNQHQTAEIYVKYREALLHSDEFTAKFLDQVRTAITQKNPSAGKFILPSNVPGPFQTRLSKYFKAPTEAGFIMFTKKATQDLSRLMKLVPGATGGYVIFAEHEHVGETYILVALLSMKAQASFNEKLDLTAAWVLDLEHLRHAARIHASEVSTNDDGVIQFVSREAGDTAGYFIDFLGCEKITDSAEQGRLLFSALTIVCKELEIDLEEARMATHAYWLDCRKQKKTMTLTTLANVIRPEDPDPIWKALGREKFRLAGEFSAPPPSSMKGFITFVYATTTFKLEFATHLWLDNISTNGKSVTIRQAPAQLIADILIAKKESEENVQINNG